MREEKGKLRASGNDLCTMKPIHFYTMIDDMLAGILLISFFKNKIDDV